MLSSMINRCLVIILSSISTDLLSWLLLACNNSFILVWLSSPANPCCLRSGLLSWTLLLVLDGWMSISPANPRCRRSGVLYCWLALDVYGWMLISPANPLGSGVLLSLVNHRYGGSSISPILISFGYPSLLEILLRSSYSLSCRCVLSLGSD